MVDAVWALPIRIAAMSIGDRKRGVQRGRRAASVPEDTMLDADDDIELEPLLPLSS